MKKVIALAGLTALMWMIGCAPRVDVHQYPGTAARTSTTTIEQRGFMPQDAPVTRQSTTRRTVRSVY